MLVAERDSHANGRVTVDYVPGVHQAVVATGATDLEREHTLISIDLDSVKTNFDALEDLLDLGTLYLGEIVSVCDNDGTKGTRPYAVDCFQRKLFVRCCLTSVDFQLPLDFFDDGGAPSNVTGRS
jgi:hypothetical protein